MPTNENQAVQALEVHQEKLSRYPNVVGLGVVSADAEDAGSEDVAVAVYVSEKVARRKLHRGQVLPKTIEVEHEGSKHDVPIRVIEQGEFELSADAGTSAEFGTEASPPSADPESDAGGFQLDDLG